MGKNKLFNKLFRLIKILPRIDYTFSFHDFIRSILILFFKKKYDKSDFYSLFPDSSLYFTNHARTGLRLILSSLNLKPGSKIGVQAFNCHTIFTAIKKAGHEIIFLDIGKDLCVSIEDIEKKKDSLDAIIITHIFGNSVNIEKIKKIVGKIPIIEDCAHSFLTEFDNKLTGTIGDAAIFSFGKGKFPSIGDGGFVVINNNSINNLFLKEYHILKKNTYIQNINIFIKNLILCFLHTPYIYGLITYHIKKEKKNININSKSFYKEGLGYFINEQLFFSKFNSYFVAKKRMDINSKIIKDTVNIISGVEEKIQGKHCFLVPILLPNPSKTVTFFKKNGIEIGQHFSCSNEWVKNFGYISSSCPKFEEVTKSIITFPCYNSLKKQDIYHIRSIVYKFNLYKL